jgi:transposase, IS5 family
VDQENLDIEIKYRCREKQLTDEERRLLKRCQAIEPIIGYLKAGYQIDCGHLK